MKLITVICSVLTGISLLITMICGLWINSNNITEPSSLNFHMTFGVISVILCFVSIVCLIITFSHIKKQQVVK